MPRILLPTVPSIDVRNIQNSPELVDDSTAREQVVPAIVPSSAPSPSIAPSINVQIQQNATELVGGSANAIANLSSGIQNLSVEEVIPQSEGGMNDQLIDENSNENLPVDCANREDSSAVVQSLQSSVDTVHVIESSDDEEVTFGGAVPETDEKKLSKLTNQLANVGAYQIIQLSDDEEGAAGGEFVAQDGKKSVSTHLLSNDELAVIQNIISRVQMGRQQVDDPVPPPITAKLEFDAFSGFIPFAQNVGIHTYVLQTY